MASDTTPGKAHSPGRSTPLSLYYGGCVSLAHAPVTEGRAEPRQLRESALGQLPGERAGRVVDRLFRTAGSRLLPQPRVEALQLPGSLVAREQRLPEPAVIVELVCGVHRRNQQGAQGPRRFNLEVGSNHPECQGCPQAIGKVPLCLLSACSAPHEAAFRHGKTRPSLTVGPQGGLDRSAIAVPMEYHHALELLSGWEWRPTRTVHSIHQGKGGEEIEGRRSGEGVCGRERDGGGGVECVLDGTTWV